MTDHNGFDLITNAEPFTAWPDPAPLPAGLKPVMAFDPGVLPPTIRFWVEDIADRMQCPIDFIATAAIVALGAVIGRSVLIKPQKHTDWCEPCNLWGCVVAPPGAMKSPAIAEALKPLHRLEAKACEANDAALKEHAQAKELFELRRDAAKKLIRNGENVDLPTDEPAPPILRRFILNDTTYEKAGEIAVHNPKGFLMHRDEIVSLFRHLEREENAAARNFYMQAWGGKDRYTFDRIMRGQTTIAAVCVSMLGTTQPAVIAEFVDKASGGHGADGWLQRFSLFVWPDTPAQWIEQDRAPDKEARDTAFATFERLATLNSAEIDAEQDDFESNSPPWLRFTPGALDLFKPWHHDLKNRVPRIENLALASHLGKYPKLVPSYALIHHLASGGVGPVGAVSADAAIRFATYLESHATRLYLAGKSTDATAARTIVSKIKSGALANSFTARTIRRKQWGGLTTAAAIQSALEVLVDFDWLAETEVPPGEKGGRRTVSYRINPAAMTAHVDGKATHDSGNTPPDHTAETDETHVSADGGGNPGGCVSFGSADSGDFSEISAPAVTAPMAPDPALAPELVPDDPEPAIKTPVTILPNGMRRIRL